MLRLKLWLLNKWIGLYYARGVYPPDWLGDAYEETYMKLYGV